MDGSSELRKIEKEIVETRALIIKATNLTSSLAADVRSLARRQSAYERNLVWNNFIVIIVVAVLAVLGAQWAYDARLSTMRSAVQAAKEDARKAREERDALRQKMGGSSEAVDAQIAALYAHIQEGDRLAAIEAFDKIDPEAMTPVERGLITDIVRRYRSEVSLEHYLKAADLLDAKKYAEAVEEFRKSLQYGPSAGHAKLARILLANALRLQGKPREAIALLQKVSEEHLDRELADDALWYLALSYQDAHQKDEAISVFRALMRRYPDSQYVREARIRAAELRLRLWRDED